MDNLNCQKCELLEELYNQAPNSARNYWLMSELFTLLHKGRDQCKKAKLLRSFDKLAKDTKRKFGRG